MNPEDPRQHPRQPADSPRNLERNTNFSHTTAQTSQFPDSYTSKIPFYKKLLKICIGNVVFGFSWALVNESLLKIYEPIGFIGVYD
jgi:hypothetical protein